MLMILSSKGLLPFKFPTNFLGSFGPAIGGLIVTTIAYGKKGFQGLWRRIITIKVNVWSYLFALLFVVIVTGISVLVFVPFNNEAIQFGGIDSLANFLLYFVIIFFLGGPLGEEIGWRGFLQPELHKKFTPLISSLFIAVVWIIWHLPLFWLEGAAQKGDSIINFAILVVCMSFLFTWLFLNAKGSVFLALLFHTSINFITAYVNPIVLPTMSENKVFNRIFTMVLVVFVILLVVIFWKQFNRKHELINEEQ